MAGTLLIGEKYTYRIRLSVALSTTYLSWSGLGLNPGDYLPESCTARPCILQFNAALVLLYGSAKKCACCAVSVIDDGSAKWDGLSHTVANVGYRGLVAVLAKTVDSREMRRHA